MQLRSTRNNKGISILELLVTVVIIVTVITVIISFYTLALRQTNRFQQQSKLKFLAEEEMEKFISIRYDDNSLSAFSNPAGITNYYEKGEFLVKTHVVFLDPKTMLPPERYPNKKADDTYLKKVTVSTARKDQLGGQVDLIFFKTP